MPVTMKQVLDKLDKDEPEYAAVASLGPQALPHLQMIIEGDDPLRASKAAYAATLIGGPGSAAPLAKAAEHHDPQVRLAVAHGMRNASLASRTEVVERLLEDRDAGVRKVALSSVADLARPEMHEKVAAMAARDPEEYLRAAAAKTIEKHKPKK